jgi:hypothetical protein
MQELEPTWQHALSVWWLLVWRSLVGGLLFGGLIGFIGFFGGMMHMPMDTITRVILGGVVGALWGIFVVRMALRKQYGKFRIALVPKAQIKEITSDYDREKLPAGY